MIQETHKINCIKNKNSLLTLLVILSFSINIFAQRNLKRADHLYNRFDYFFAIKHYNAYLKNHKLTLDIAENMANSYRLTNNTIEEEGWYARTLTFPDSDSGNIFSYAEALRKNGKYKDAKNQYLNYKQLVPAEKNKINSLLAYCDSANNWMKNPLDVLVMNESALNTGYSEFSPVFYNNGLVFASDRILEKKNYHFKDIFGWTGNPYIKLYQSKIINGTVFQAPVFFDQDINKEFHDGPAAFPDNENVIYFTRTTKIKIKAQQNNDPTSWIPNKNSTSNYINRLEIYSAERKENSWKNINPFQYNKPSEYSLGHPAFSPKGDILYFVADMPGGYGETDIYFCKKINDTSWSEPKNVGAPVNTSGKECFPSLDKNGTLYFSSNGHPGMGGLDLFSAIGAGNSWSDVTNLKYPFNSSKDDLGIAFDTSGSSGYFSSNRDGGLGNDDIYRFEPSKKRKEKIDPVHFVSLPELPKKSLSVNIYFDFDKSDIRQDAAPELNNIIADMLNNKDIRIEISSFTDCRGSAAYNLNLSRQRTEAAVNYMVSRGVDKKKITSKYFGESQLVNHCADGVNCTEQEHQLNRRAELMQVPLLENTKMLSQISSAE